MHQKVFLTQRTLSKDLSLILIFSITGFFLLACLIELLFLGNIDKQYLKNQSSTIIKNASRVIASPLWSMDKQSIEKIIDQYNNFEQVNKIFVFDENQQVVTSFTRLLSSQDLIQRQDIYHNGSIVGHLEMHFSNKIPAKQKSYLIITLITLIGLLIICIFTTMLVLKYFLNKPLKDIIINMETISSGKKVKRLELPPQNELAKIVSQTNELAIAVFDREQSLENQKLRLVNINKLITTLTKASSLHELIELSASALSSLSKARVSKFKPHEANLRTLNMEGIKALTKTNNEPQLRGVQVTHLSFDLMSQSKIIGTFELIDITSDPEISKQDIPTIVSLIEELIDKIQVIKINMTNLAEMKIAQSVQQGMLAPPRQGSMKVDLAFLYKPMNKIGGDWFRVWASSDNKNLYLMMGDVTGHGVGSGLVTTAVNGTLQTLEHLAKGHTLNIELEPENIMNTLNNLLESISTQSNLHMTCVIAKISLTSDTLSLCNAGHTFPLILKGVGTPPQISPLTKSQQPMLGEEFSKGYKYKSVRYSFNRDEYLLLFTDGLLEAQDENKQAFSRRFIRLLKQLDVTDNSHDLKNIIDEKLSDHCQNVGLKDDICLLIIKK